jgi:hypothetical protein
MKPDRAKMPGSNVGYAISYLHFKLNFAGTAIPTFDAETEAFRASEGLIALRIQERLKVSLCFVHEDAH